MAERTMVVRGYATPHALRMLAGAHPNVMIPANVLHVEPHPFTDLRKHDDAMRPIAEADRDSVPVLVLPLTESGDVPEELVERVGAPLTEQERRDVLQAFFDAETLSAFESLYCAVDFALKERARAALRALSTEGET